MFTNLTAPKSIYHPQAVTQPVIIGYKFREDRSVTGEVNKPSIYYKGAGLGYTDDPSIAYLFNQGEIMEHIATMKRSHLWGSKHTGHWVTIYR